MSASSSERTPTPQSPVSTSAETLPALRPLAQSGPPLLNAQPGYQSLSEYYRAIKRSAWLILVSSALTGSLAMAVAFTLTPSYQAHLKLEIQDLNSDFLNRRDVDPTATSNPASADSYIPTQLGILQSRALIVRTVSKVNLPNRFASVAKPGLVGRFLSQLRLEQRLASFLKKPTRLAVWMRVFRWMPPSLLSPEARAVAQVEDNLTARTGLQTRIVDVLYSAPNPQIASDFLNALADEYIQQNLEVRWAATEHTGEFLTERVRGLRAELERSEAQLQQYASVTGLPVNTAKEDESAAEEKLRQLQAELSRAQNDTISKLSEVEIAKAVSPASLPATLSDSHLRTMEGTLADLKREQARLLVSLTPQNTRVAQVQAQIDDLERAIEGAQQNLLQSVQHEYDSARHRESLLQSAFDAQSKLVSEQAVRSVKYDLLRHEVESERQVYDSMMQRVKTAGVTAALQATNIRVMDPATPPLLPNKPNVPLAGGIGLAAGALIGAMFAVLRDRNDRRLRRPVDVQTYLSLPELGVIPAVEPQLLGSTGLSERMRYRLFPHHAAKTVPGKANVPENPQSDATDFASWTQQPWQVAEAFRNTAATILHKKINTSSIKVLVISSPNASEGKTTVISNLAIALAETGRKVVVIDCDFRRPRLHEVFDVANTWGVSDLVADSVPVESIDINFLVRNTKVPGLSIIPSGPAPSQLTQLLHSSQMVALISRLRKEFDFVLIDSPPSLKFSDARVLARSADAAVLVFRSEQTLREGAFMVAQRFADDEVIVLGAILNDWKPGRKEALEYGYSDTMYAQ